MPNQPKTPVRGVRISEDLWRKALSAATRNGETVTDIIRRALEKYVTHSEEHGHD